MPENEERRRSLIFPILLILLGVGFLLSQLGLWSLNWADLWRWWPLLLVLIGLDIILSGPRWGGLVTLGVLAGLVVLALVFARPFGGPVGNSETETFNVPAQGVTSATLQFYGDAGGVKISPLADSANLVEAQARHDRARTEVTHDVALKGGKAEVTLRSRSRQTNWVPFGRTQDEEWQIGLSPEVPLSLEMNTGISDANIDLTGLQLERVDLNSGVGNARLTLSEKGRYEIRVNGGVGSVTIDIPRELAASITVHGGLGSVDIAPRFVHHDKTYVSEDYATAKNSVAISVDGGVGSITIR